MAELTLSASDIAAAINKSLDGYQCQPKHAPLVA